MTENILNQKKILFIGVKFYHYHQEVIHKLTKDYCSSVTYFPERDTSIKYGIVNRLAPNMLESYQEYYYKKILSKIKEKKFDYFLVIRGFQMPLWFVQKVKELNPGLKTINYQWDSNTNSPFIDVDSKINILPEFDAKFSFDYKDVKEHDDIEYCPIFYTDEIKKIGMAPRPADYEYDLFYFGSYLPERYKGLLRFIEYAEQNNIRLKTYFYMPIRYYLIERLKGAKIDWKLIKFKPMNRKEYINLFLKSKAIVDVSNEKQTGMAMRVIDVLGSGKKLVTTNKWIKNDEIYDEKQIHIIDINNIEIPKYFLLDQTVHQPKEISNLDNWIRKIFAID
ncbi:CgeB family protein [Pedobacter cryotolerans]|uniref:Lipopolysaccharide biosynthesis protein n=1 Tax=Pedobacter cryotolerans TaxID=2571270 RepID=A0A4U1C3G4_9SPHI|nr:hypothetical protein [Pedobacter cryotolerans]TKB99651.1 hypothetical protein FA045_12135 [Pedobacter cryotolerans]